MEEEHSFKLNEKELEAILLDKRVADKKVQFILLIYIFIVYCTVDLFNYDRNVNGE